MNNKIGLSFVFHLRNFGSEYETLVQTLSAKTTKVRDWSITSKSYTPRQDHRSEHIMIFHDSELDLSYFLFLEKDEVQILSSPDKNLEELAAHLNQRQVGHFGVEGVTFELQDVNVSIGRIAKNNVISKNIAIKVELRFIQNIRFEDSFFKNLIDNFAELYLKELLVLQDYREMVAANWDCLKKSTDMFKAQSCGLYNEHYYIYTAIKLLGFL